MIRAHPLAVHLLGTLEVGKSIAMNDEVTLDEGKKKCWRLFTAYPGVCDYSAVLTEEPVRMDECGQLATSKTIMYLFPPSYL